MFPSNDFEFGCLLLGMAGLIIAVTAYWLLLISRKSLRCLLFGHKRYIEDMGGMIVEVCERCPWTGREHDYIDPF